MWNFFESGATPLAEVRWCDGGPWLAALGELRRPWWALLYHPESVGRLFAVSCFQRLLEESQDYLDHPERFCESVTYQLCARLARAALLGQGREFQFRLRCGSEVVFVSAVEQG